MDDENHFLLTAIKNGNKEAFSLIFRKYYKDMVLFGGNYLPDKSHCEDIVQNIFLNLWENRENVDTIKSLRSFLLQSVRNGCLDELRHSSIVQKHESESKILFPDFNFDVDHYMLYSELQNHLSDALSKLSPACRQAFEMNRFEGLKYKEIAVKLSVSERTVEVYISKAVSLLKEYLKNFRIMMIFFFI